MDPVKIMKIMKYFRSNKLKSTFVAICLWLLLHRIWFYWHKKRNRLPPGPYGLPIMGVFFARLYHGFKHHEMLADKYGPIVWRKSFGVNNGIVDIQNTKIIRQVLSNKHSISRPPRNKTNGVYISASDKGLFSFADINEEEGWQKRRQLAQSVLFRACTGKFVNSIVDESLIKTVFPELDKLSTNKQIWYPRKFLYYTAFNSLFQANFGRSIDIDDPLYLRLHELIDKTFALFLSSFIISHLSPLLRRILVRESTINEIRDTVNERSKKIRDLIEIRKKEYDPDNPTAYIDYVFNEGLNDNTNNITQDQLEADIQALFSAGTDTTASTLEYAIILIARDIDIQNKVRKELIACYNEDNKNNENKDGGYRRFDISWLKSLTLFRALVHEIMRISSVAILGLPHYTTNEIEVDVEDKKYVIPKDCIIFYHIEANHIKRTDENWKKTGKEIYLENWINEENGKFEQNESWITFGSGRRDCVGRQLAMKEIHVVLGYLLLNYKFGISNEEDKTRQITCRFDGVKMVDPPIGINVTRL